MTFGQSVSRSLVRGTVVLVVLAVIAAALAVTLNAIEAWRAPRVAEKALASQQQQQQPNSRSGEGEMQPPHHEPESVVSERFRQRVVVLSPDIPSRWTRFWYGDPWNRDPVCGGDPICRDAYFRDWPYARRPHSHAAHPPHQQPITITNTNTTHLPPAPPLSSQSAPAPSFSQSAPAPFFSQSAPAESFPSQSAPAESPPSPAGSGCNSCERRKRAMAGLLRS